MNRFVLAHYARGSITERQLTALDSFLIRLGREHFGQYRSAVGIPAGTPNRFLESWQASRLLDAIISDLEREE